ncbi:MAG: hypothetical protein ABL940_11535 [Bacteroidia bacterium]
MKFIDKSQNEKEINDVVNLLLEDAWNILDNKYIGANYYDGLSKPKYKLKLEKLFSQQQDNYCCYCMADISLKNNITLEHIIPQKVNQEEFGKYLNSSEILKKNVICKSDFNINEKTIPPLKYPHDIANYNLVASCASKKHCNNHRENKFVSPFIYDSNINTTVVYDNAGRIDNEKYNDDIYILGISSDHLIFIRYFWSYISHKKVLSLITEGDIDDFIFEVILKGIFSDNIIDKFTGSPSYKADIFKYKYFHTYYNQHNT